VLSSLALWGLMARGGLPNLSSLWLHFDEWVWGPGLGPALVAAFEGVAGTLKALALIRWDMGGVYDDAEADGVMLQVGEAIGKLRRLEALQLEIDGPGEAYHLIAQGMAKGACPALRSLTCTLDREAAWLACRPSIILPSVQVLHVHSQKIGAEPLALAFGLTSLGYRGSLVMSGVCYRQRDQVRAILPPQVHVRFVKHYSKHQSKDVSLF
jgi:hypothetical protein